MHSRNFVVFDSQFFLYKDLPNFELNYSKSTQNNILKNSIFNLSKSFKGVLVESP